VQTYRKQRHISELTPSAIPIHDIRHAIAVPAMAGLLPNVPDTTPPISKPAIAPKLVKLAEINFIIKVDYGGGGEIFDSTVDSDWPERFPDR